MPKNLNEDLLDRSDLDTILEVNKKAVELQTEVSGQFEDLSEELAEVQVGQLEIKKLIIEMKETQTKVYLLLSVGVVSLIIQLIQLLRH